jgi:peptide/nickel transport system permease protein
VRRYLVKRALGSVLTLAALIVGLFFALHALGDPVALMLDDDYSQEQYHAVEHRLGYDRPLMVQFADQMGDVFRGDLGESIRSGQPTVKLVFNALPKTLFLGLLAFLISMIGVPLGVIAATRPRSILDTVINSGSFALISAPNFWVALVAIYFFAVKLNVLPTSGFNGYSDIKFMVLPALVLAMNSLARFAQITRTVVMEELAKPYVQTAHAKGLAAGVVLWLHVLKNAAIPILTVAGDEAASIVNGSVIMETVFGWPGMGFLMVTAIQQRDLPLVIATVVIAAALVMLVNFVVDMIYSWVDPRIKYQ